MDGAEPTITNQTWLRIECTGQAFSDATTAAVWKDAVALHFHCEGATTPEEIQLCTRTPGRRDEPAVAHPSMLRALTSFVDLSDAQLKEAWIHMEGALGDETSYDGLQSASKRDDLLQQNDDAVLLAMVLGINAMKDRLPDPPATQAGRWAGLPAPRRPTFVIHTGDSVDSGMFSELLQFIAAMDQLKIPYFNVIGNHDNMFFGTIPADLVSGTNVVAPYVPILTTERFMRFHSTQGREDDPTLPSPSARGEPHATPSKLITSVPGSIVVGDPAAPTWTNGEYHGFDLACGSNSAPNGLCNEARGYYAFDLSLGDEPATWTPAVAKLRVIVLNTAEVIPASVPTAVLRRSRANMLPAQFEWLERQLHHVEGEGPPTFYLVVGHHDLASFLEDDQAARLKKLLFDEPRVLAYLTAHTHVDDVVTWKRPKGGDFFEIIAGSTLVYPQLGRLVELLVDPEEKRLVLRLLTFRQALGDRAYSLLGDPAASAGCEVGGAMAPKCREVEPASSYCQALANRAYFGRVGAARDPDGDRRDELEAVSKTSGLFPVFRFDSDAEFATVDALTRRPAAPPAPTDPPEPEAPR